MFNPVFWVSVFGLCIVGGVVDAVRVYRNKVVVNGDVVDDVRVGVVDVLVNGVRWFVVVSVVYVFLRVFSVSVAGATELGSATGCTTDAAFTTAICDLNTPTQFDGTMTEIAISATSMIATTICSAFDTDCTSKFFTDTSNKFQNAMTHLATLQSNSTTPMFDCAEKERTASAMTDIRDSSIDTCNGYGTTNAIEMALTNTSRTDRTFSINTGCTDIAIGMRTTRMLLATSRF